MMMEIARSIHEAACKPFDAPYDGRLARPFGTPEDMPPHIWVVSPDVLQALYNESPPPVAPNPKNGDDGTRRLFGWPVVDDKSVPAGTIRLVLF